MLMTILILALSGLIFGSFVTALTWRIHEKKDFIAGRSQCESCGHRLGTLDLIPVVSWMALSGRCRYCKAPVSWQNPAIELSVMIAFVVSYLFWPVDLTTWQAYASFGIWLIYIVILMALLVYDLRWMLLPNQLVFPLIALGLIDAVLRVGMQGPITIFTFGEHVLLGAGVLAGVYWLLYTVSRGKWVGYGDVKLGLFMGIVLGWQQALLTLFLANIIGCLFVGPGLLTGKLTPKSRVPFGPFLIVSFLIAGIFGQQLINWYVSLIIGS